MVFRSDKELAMTLTGLYILKAYNPLPQIPSPRELIASCGACIAST